MTLITTPGSMWAPASAPPTWHKASAYLLGALPPTMALDFGNRRFVLAGARVRDRDMLTRTGDAKYVTGPSGGMERVPANRLAYTYASGRCRLLREAEATNLFRNDYFGSTDYTVTAQPYTIAWTGAGAVTMAGAHAATLAGAGEGQRRAYTFTPTAGTLSISRDATTEFVQLEVGLAATSYIPTTNAAASRVTDVVALTPAAVAALSISACTLAWRGAIRTAASNQRLLGLAGSGVLVRAASNGTGWLMTTPVGQGTATAISGAPSMPGEFGLVMGWDASGTIACVNGVAPTTTTVAAAGSITAVYLGSSSGMTTGARHEDDELVIWPAMGAAAAVQAQARAYIV